MPAGKQGQPGQTQHKGQHTQNSFPALPAKLVCTACADQTLDHTADTERFHQQQALLDQGDLYGFLLQASANVHVLPCSLNVKEPIFNALVANYALNHLQV